MAIRITCPSCDTALKFDDEKSGKKVRCKECDKSITLPADKGGKRKRDEDESIQDSRTMKAKASRSKSKSRAADDDDDETERPSKKKKQKKGGLPMGLILGGVGAVVFLCLIGVGGVGAFFLFRKPAAPQLAANADAKNDGHVATPEPEKKKDPDPVKTPDPVKSPDPIKPPPAGGSDQLTPDAVRRVEQATVYLSVRTGDGQKAEGSGFFCIEPGLVITNAHVLGMTQAKAPPPTKIEVVLSSGNPDERKVDGILIGVDRVNDLAVLRVNVPNAPPPLEFEDPSSLFRTQKVFVSGFPGGRSLGKEITISPSSISSLRKDTTGMLAEIQVNGGMHSGNSGGPVISQSGKLVGVAVAIIRGTQLNFAIPGDFVKRLMDGRSSDVTTGEAYAQNGQTKLPVKVLAIDPLNKIRSMRVEVWTGSPGENRPLSSQQPSPMPGDSAHLPQPLNYQAGAGSADVTVPTAGPGQVYWLQPVITNADGKTQWGVAISTSVTISSPLDRKPADLTVNLTGEKMRTVNLKSNLSLTIPEGKVKHVIAIKVETEMLEVMNPDPKGSRIKTSMGTTASYTDIDGEKKTVGPKSLDIVRNDSPGFGIDNTNRIFSKKNLIIRQPVSPDTKSEAERTFGQISNAFQAMSIPMPNKVVQPGEKWNTTGPLMMGSGPKASIADLLLTCTYEGVRMRNQRNEGLISVTGIVKGRPKFKGKAQPQGPADEVSGKVAFDLAGGFISFAQLKILSEGEFDTVSIDVDLTRAPGNTKNLPIPADKDPGPMPKDPLAKGKVVLQQAAFLAFTDPFDPTQPVPAKKKAYYKQIPVQMQAGKTYTVAVNSPAFPARVRVLAANGAVVAQGQGGGNITYQATAAGAFFINVCTTNGNIGQFQVTVTESP